MLQAELVAFLENSTDGVFAVRESGEICFWNHAARKLFGYSEDDVLGNTCSRILHGVGAHSTQDFSINKASAIASCLPKAAFNTHSPEWDITASAAYVSGFLLTSLSKTRRTHAVAQSSCVLEAFPMKASGDSGRTRFLRRSMILRVCPQSRRLGSDANFRELHSRNDRCS